MIDPIFFALLFWAGLAVLSYTFLGYPVFVFWLGALSRWPQAKGLLPDPPTVTVVLCVHNEQDRIRARLQNLLSTTYPPDKLDILVVADGSTDDTVAGVNALAHPRVAIIVEPTRHGKADALNFGVAAAGGEIVVFADARQHFAPETIPQLARHFQDSRVGAVSGALEIDPAASAVGGGVDAYWRLEKFIRAAESQWDSAIGCTGAIYAIRRQSFQAIPADTLLDDVVIPMQIANQGLRVLFDPSARAFDPQPLEPHRERIRKRRTLAGNFQMLLRYPGWLLPWRNRLWWQLISHKYLRLLAPFLLPGVLLANSALLEVSPYRYLFFGQSLFYGCACLGLVFSSWRVACFSLPAGFVFLNWMTLTGLWHYLRGAHRQGWQMTPS